ncbi:hypothetical protein FUA23_08340 [Neolewinella aurantiaca]|uniref:Uncharacterized protein n=1 Tax=Neolewinella aurantiaca TaxID=2602767 RepID=A0A5C7FFH1_9BACT|nr:hypothetical protein [Neolewinella aurantiaca]TXF89956.1 hypothetical protein FUA23_08340 [Neolewinella aurantiaca]
MDPVRAISISGLCLFSIGAILRYTTSSSAYDVLMIIPVIAIGAALALAPQLRWRYWLKHAPDLPVELAPLLERFDLYRRLDLEGKREFRRRTFLLKERFHFRGEAIEEIPADVEIMVAASAATAGFHREDFLLGDYETIVFYRHFFPTPEHEVLHCSELYPPDGAIIWTFAAFLRSCIEPKKYLHLGLYEFGRAMMNLEPELRAKLDAFALDYPSIAKLSGFTEVKLKEYIGLPELDLTAITLVLYFTHREEMAVLQKELLEKTDALLVKPTAV